MAGSSRLSLTTKMSSCLPLSVSLAFVKICSLKMVLSAGNSIDATNTVAYTGLICAVMQDVKMCCNLSACSGTGLAEQVEIYIIEHAFVMPKSLAALQGRQMVSRDAKGL